MITSITLHHYCWWMHSYHDCKRRHTREHLTSVEFHADWFDQLRSSVIARRMNARYTGIRKPRYLNWSHHHHQHFIRQSVQLNTKCNKRRLIIYSIKTNGTADLTGITGRSFNLTEVHSLVWRYRCAVGGGGAPDRGCGASPRSVYTG